MRHSRFPNPVHMSCIMPVGLKKRLVRRAAKETDDNGIRVTPSDIMRDAIEEYLDLYEGATFVPARAARTRALTMKPPQKLKRKYTRKSKRE